MVAAYWRTNLTMRQLAPPLEVSRSAADRITDCLGPTPALQPRKRFAGNTILIVDGTLVPTREPHHRRAVQELPVLHQPPGRHQRRHPPGRRGTPHLHGLRLPGRPRPRTIVPARPRTRRTHRPRQPRTYSLRLHPAPDGPGHLCTLKAGPEARALDQTDTGAPGDALRPVPADRTAAHLASPSPVNPAGRRMVSPSRAQAAGTATSVRGPRAALPGEPSRITAAPCG